MLDSVQATIEAAVEDDPQADGLEHEAGIWAYRGESLCLLRFPVDNPYDCNCIVRERSRLTLFR